MKSIIPVTGAPIENFNLVLKQKLYTFKIMFNARFNFWTLSLYVNQAPLFESFKLVQGVNIGEIFNIDIGGKLYIESISNDLSDPTRNDFGKDKQLIYDDTL